MKTRMKPKKVVTLPDVEEQAPEGFFMLAVGDSRLVFDAQGQQKPPADVHTLEAAVTQPRRSRPGGRMTMEAHETKRSGSAKRAKLITMIRRDSTERSVPDTDKLTESDDVKSETVAGTTLQILEMMTESGGASATRLRLITGWTSRAVRGFVCGVLGRRLGLPVRSEKRDGEWYYFFKK